MSLPLIRLATPDDLVAINQIYNYYISRSTCTYQEQPDSIDARREWFDHHGERYPITVAEANGKLVGWGALSLFHSRCAYRFTAENSVYVHHEHHRQGIGTALLSDLIDRARAADHHTLVASIDTEQVASIALHRKFHFTEAAHLREVGFKFDRWLDVVYLQRIL